MKACGFIIAASLAWAATARADAPGTPDIAPGEKEPILLVQAGGPTSLVRALAMCQSPDGGKDHPSVHLYVAGYDKVVRVYTANKDGKFALQPMTYRVPVAPGLDGSINAVAVSPDGTWLAAGGLGVVRDVANYRRPGLIVFREGRMTPAMLKDQGTIWLFNTRTHAVRPLRGHKGPVLSLAFAPAADDKPPLLISAGREWDAKDSKFYGGVRVWDVTTTGEQTQVKQWVGIPLPDRNVSPGLAAWHTGKRPTQLQVAMAWGDGSLRVWDLEHDQDGVTKVDDGRLNTTIAYVPERGQLLTGSNRNDDAIVRLWKTQGPDMLGGVRFPPDGGLDLFPQGLTLFSSREGGPADHAALVMRVGADSQAEYRLAIVKLTADGADAVERQIPLWKCQAALPPVAAVPGGRFLAVAGNDVHEVKVFAISDLLAGRNRPQRLHSVGATFGALAFAHKDKDVALLLRERVKQAPGDTLAEVAAGDLILDVNRRALGGDSNGWKIDAPEDTGWRATLEPLDAQSGKPAVAVYEGQRLVRRVELKRDFEVTQFALLPPHGSRKAPILALAYLDNNAQPWLSLYQAETGEQFRQLTGHTDPIRGLAFSEDGKLLASAAEDQTVCVWSMTNVAKTLGTRGMLKGVGVKPQGNVVAVTHLDADSPARRTLRRGDVIEGLVEKGVLRPIKSPRDFYDEMTLRKPGAAVTFRIRGKQDVTLRLGQAVDERKPLFTVFITRGRTAADREWLGWSPIGPYDSSDRKTERLIGWHINTGNPARPTSFATAEQYRKELYRPGILKNLVARGDLSAALTDWDAEDSRRVLPDPKTNVWVKEIGPDPRKRDGNGQVVVQKKPVTLVLRVDDFPLEKIDSVDWQLVGEATRHPFDEPLGAEWSADLSTLPWTRGKVYRIRAAIRTNEAEPREHVRDILLRYQPPPPVIVRAGNAVEGVQRLVVHDKAEFPFAATIRPAEGEDVRVELTQSNPKINKPAHWSESLDVDRRLTLLPGENVVQLVATNKGAPADAKEIETTRLTLIVVYEPPQVKVPPQIDVDRVIVLGEEGTELKVTPDQPIVVHDPKIQVLGKVSAKDPLEEAAWLSESQPLKALSTFTAGHTSADIEETLPPLKPGRQTIRFQTRSAGGRAEAALVVDYHPRLPAVTLLRPEREVNLFDDGNGFPELDVAWQATPSNEHPFEVKLVVNGQELGTPSFDRAEQALLAKVKMPRPGDNVVQLRLSNAWNETALSEAVQVHCLRPPLVAIAGAKTLTTEKAFTDLIFQITSALPVVHSSTRAEVNGRSISSVEWLDGNRLRLKDVPLTAGRKNEISLWVSNEDGRCRTPGRVRVVYQPPVQKVALPEVEILDPHESTLTDAEVTVRGLIHTTAPLRKVELVREGDHPFRKTLTVGAPNAQGVVPFEQKVPLVPRANRIRVAAVNDGGAADALVSVTYLFTPARLVVDSLRARNGHPVHPEPLPDGELRVPQVDTGRVTIQGRVLADKMDAEKFKKISRVCVFVNGFQQVPALLKPPASPTSRERAFETELLLNQYDNLVEIELPDIKEDANDRRAFSLVCKQPVAGQRLHYLIMGVGDQSADELKKEALDAIGAKPDKRGDYHTSAFSEIRLYGPLNGFVRPEYVFTQLCLIKQTVDLLARYGSANDVILVYFHGEEAINGQGHFFKTSLSRSIPILQRSAITCTGLESYLRDTLGAKLLWLDVARDHPEKGTQLGEGRDRIVKWDDTVHAAVWRAGWPQGTPDVNGRPLLKALDEETPKGRRLQDVATGVDSLFEKLFPKSLTYVLNNPEPYRGLVIGPGR